MSQTAELDRVKSLVRALTARTVERGCSEAEAMEAAAKVGQLLSVYGLSMTEVALRDEACAERRLMMDGTGAPALRWLFPALLRFTGCRGWTDGRHEMVLFGLDPDVQMGEWLLLTLAAALRNETARFHASGACPRRNAAAALRSFRYGFAARVAARLDELAAEQEQTVAARDAQAAGGTALVLAKARKIDAAFAQLGVKLRTVRSRATIADTGAFRRGEAAGDRVGLDRPVEPGAGPARLARGKRR